MPISTIQLGTVTEKAYNRDVHELLYVFDRPKKERNKMPITVVAAKEAPQQSGRGLPIPELYEVIEALKSFKQGTAIKVALSHETLLRLSKNQNGKERNPYRQFANSLKRHFNENGLNYSAYPAADGKSTVVIYAVPQSKPKK